MPNEITGPDFSIDYGSGTNTSFGYTLTPNAGGSGPTQLNEDFGTDSNGHTTVRLNLSNGSNTNIDTGAVSLPPSESPSDPFHFSQSSDGSVQLTLSPGGSVIYPATATIAPDGNPVTIRSGFAGGTITEGFNTAGILDGITQANTGGPTFVTTNTGLDVTPPPVVSNGTTVSAGTLHLELPGTGDTPFLQAGSINATATLEPPGATVAGGSVAGDLEVVTPGQSTQFAKFNSAGQEITTTAFENNGPVVVDQFGTASGLVTGVTQFQSNVTLVATAAGIDVLHGTIASGGTTLAAGTDDLILPGGDGAFLNAGSIDATTTLAPGGGAGGTLSYADPGQVIVATFGVAGKEATSADTTLDPANGRPAAETIADGTRTADITGLEGSAQTITVTDPNTGVTATYQLAAGPEPTVGVVGAGQTGSAADAILAGMDNATLNPGTGDRVLLALGNADTIVSDAGTQGIILAGSGDMVTQTGTAASAAVVQDNAAGNTIDLSNATIRLTAGETATIAGSNDTVVGAAGDTVTLTGGGNTVTLGAGDDLTAVGGNNTINITTGDRLTISGTGGAFDTVQGSGDAGGTTAADGQASGIFMGANTQANIGGNGDTISSQTGDSLGVYGGGNTIDAGAGQYVVIGNTNGSYDTVQANGDQMGGTTANGQATEIALNPGAQANIAGGNDTVGLGAGDTLGLTQGGGYNVYGSGTTINALAGVTGTINGSGDTLTDGAAGAQFNFNGGGDTATLGNGDYAGLVTGTNYTINVNDGTVEALANVGATVNGSSDSIGDDNAGASFNLNGSNNTLGLGNGDYAGLLGGGGNTISLNNGTIEGLANVSATIDGSGDTVGDGHTGVHLDFNGGNDAVSLGGAGDYVGLDSGTGYTITANNGTVDGQGGVGATINGTGETINDGGAGSSFTFNDGYDTANLGSVGNHATLLGGAGYVIDENNSTSVEASNVSATIIGNDDTANGNAGGTLGFLGSADTATIAHGTVNLDDSTVGSTTIDSSVDVQGNRDRINTSGHNTLTLGGDNDTIHSANFDTIDLSSGSIDDALLGYYDGINLGAYDGLDLIGSDDTTNAAGHDTFYAQGTYDGFTGANSFVDYYGSDVGDDVQGSGDVGDNWSDPGNGQGYGGGSTPTGYGGGGGYYGFVRLSGNKALSGIDAVAAFDLRHGLVAAAQSAEAAKVKALFAASGTSSVSPFEAARWDSSTITYAFAQPSPTNAIAGAIPAADQAIVESAIGAWAKAAGINPILVSNPATADIRIGWGDLDTASSGVIGYTTIRAQGGMQSPGATVLLESPIQNPFIAGPQGPTYSVGGASLYEVALHELGHAFGLAESSNPSSVMYPYLGPSNASLSAADAANLRELYAGGIDRASISGAVGVPFGSATPFMPTGSFVAMMREANHGFDMR